MYHKASTKLARRVPAATPRVRRMRSPSCCENCACPGCPGCPDARGRMNVTAIEYGLRSRPWGMGDDAVAFDPVAACMAGGGSAASCGAITTGGGASSGGLEPWQAALQAQQRASGGGGGSDASTAGSLLGGVLKAFAGPSGPQYGMPGYPGYGYPPGYQPGMSTMTKVALAGGAALALVFLSRR